MKVYELDEILAALDEDAARAAIEDGFRRFSAGQVQPMAVGHLGFEEPPGDCHVKGAYRAGDEVYAIKAATSFYRNPQQGLPSSNGFVVIMSAHTGALLALLHDRGQLTDIRTAMAGAIAARAIARPGARTLGVVGTGIQARLQARHITRLLGLDTVLIWGRQADRANALAGELSADLAAEAVDMDELCGRADIIVTTTPSTETLLHAGQVRAGTRIVAVGADSPGKRELDPRLMAQARIVVDSRLQCIDHGDTGWAVRAGLVDPRGLVELGELLAHPLPFAPEDIVVADLTGLGVQDLEIAKSVWRQLVAREAAPAPAQ
jgi:ornithine cyclodeaminase